MTAAGFPHWDTLGSTLGCQLPEAYRRLPRPSSALGAKASTLRSSFTSHHNFDSYDTPRTTPTATTRQGRHDRHPREVAKTKDARVHCAVLKQQPAPAHPPPPDGRGRAVLRPDEQDEPATTHPATPTHRRRAARPTVVGSAGGTSKDEERPAAGSAWLLPQDPTACSGRRSTREPPPGARSAPAWDTPPHQPTHAEPHPRPPTKSGPEASEGHRRGDQAGLHAP